LSNQKYLFLYSELAGYTIACFKHFAEKFSPEIELHVVHFPINPEAPFQFEFPEKVRFYSREKYDLLGLRKLVTEINPDKIACSGWIDKDYLKVCQKYKSKIPVIVTFDNHWEGSLKQYLASALSPVFIKRYFNKVWVPGNSKQLKFAEKLGFKKSQISKGFYCADIPLYQNFFNLSFEKKKEKFPKRFIYVGRYVAVKRIEMLWKTFIDICTENPNEWELWCLGTGNITPISHPQIKHFGFVQPNDMLKYIENCGVYILPSSFEPWGVAVQEMAIGGLPLICSNEVGATEILVKENQNGFIFNNEEELKKIMLKIIKYSNENLIEMGKKSNIIGQEINLNQWADTFYNF
jgi:glycosyltransferase involved in cell wall biosynthesis